MGERGSDWFAELYRRHYDAVFRYARRRIEEDLARDVTAEAFLVAWRRANDVPGDALPWLYRVAALALANATRSKRRQEHLVRRIHTVGDHTPYPDHADQAGVRVAVAEALDRLSPRDREVLRLAAWEGLDPPELATVLGCSRTAAKVRLHRARRRLGALLRRHYPDLIPDPRTVTEARPEVPKC